MKALFLHANRWASYFETPSERIGDTEVEEVEVSSRQALECMIVFFQVEARDSPSQVSRLCQDIEKTAKKLQTKRLVVECFAHLSDSRPDPTVAKDLVSQVLQICRGFENHEIFTSPFGWNKGLDLSIKGHQNAFMFRSYK